MKLERLLHAIDNTTELVGKAASWLIIPIAFILVYESTLRYAFNKPTIWAHETTQMMFGALFILGVAWIYRYGEHVNMDVVYKLFPVRVQGVVDMVTSIFFFAVCITMLWKGGQIAWESFLALERSYNPWHPPIWPLKFTIPIAGFLLLLQGVAEFIRNYRKVTGRRLV